MLASHLGGNVVLHKVAHDDRFYDGTNADIIKRIQKEARGRLVACLCLENSGKKKHREMLKSLNSQQTLKNDQCPKNVLDATRALSQHKWGNG